MKKIGIITINDNLNYGNRLQNYAMQEFFKKANISTETIENRKLNHKKVFILRLKRHLGYLYKKILSKRLIDKRYVSFLEFNKNIRFSKYMLDKECEDGIIKWKYTYFVVGSDQVWNPNINRLSKIDLLCFADNNQKIAFSASFGISKLPEEHKEKTRDALKKFKAISVREDAGKEIINNLGINKDVEVLVDPTMLLSAEEWDKVSNKPKNIKDGEKYILNYFLGKLPNEWDKEIKRIAKENDCKIINILDANDPYFVSGPSEFLYLEKNAFLVCTDSFHSSVFSIIYGTPFIIFNRIDNHISMNSRLDTLLSKFGLENRKFNGSIPDDLLKCDYSNAKKILEKEKQKSKKFLCKALDINE